MMFALSLYWNFDLSVNPSKEFPYVVAGRMLTSLLVPFAILYVDGLQRATGWLGRAAPTLVLVSVLLGLLISELVLMWPVVQSPYNFWHLRA
jgi:hypothetical protein